MIEDLILRRDGEIRLCGCRFIFGDMYNEYIRIGKYQSIQKKIYGFL